MTKMTMKTLLQQPCQCGIEVDSKGGVHSNHTAECAYGKALAEEERLSWTLAGVSTAVLGYLKPTENYSGKPIQQIEEAIVLREAFRLACDQVHRCTDAPEQSLSSTMSHYLELARKYVAAGKCGPVSPASGPIQ